MQPKMLLTKFSVSHKSSRSLSVWRVVSILEGFGRC